METFPLELSQNIVLISLVLFYVFVNILAWSKGGVMFRELDALLDMRNERTFNFGEIDFGWTSPFLRIQYYLFFGLCLFLAAIPNAVELLEGLLTLSADLYIRLGICIVLPFVWSVLHFILYHWICFMFGGDSRIVILDRFYLAVHTFAGPLVMVLFLASIVTEISPILIAVLLSLIFIIVQIAFIFSGFKIFFNSFSSICLFFVYLCALEISPLALLYVKLGT